MSEPTPDEEDLMTRDDLDDLLDASTPAARTLEKRVIRAMVVEARGEVRTAPRAKRAALISGALALLMAGGAGVAVAADFFDWANLNNPIGSYTYQLPSGATCDVVFGDVQIVERKDGERRDQIERDLRNWFETTDVVGVAVSEVEEYLPRAQRMTVPGDENRTDTAYSTAFDMSVSDQAMAELERLGYDDEVAGYGSQGSCSEPTP